MARKSLSLDALMSPEPSSEPVQSEVAAPKSVPATEPRSSKPSYREGKRAFTAWAHADAYKQLKHLATDRETTVQALLEEGMDMVFQKYGYDKIARG